MDIYGTLGPACLDLDILIQMFQMGMTGIRLNLSHTTLKEASHMISLYQQAARKAGVSHPKLLIDMQGPEIRVGEIKEAMELKEGEKVLLGEGAIPIPEFLFPYLQKDQRILLDDGKILISVMEIREDRKALCKIIRGGLLKSKKSIAIEDCQIPIPTLTKVDLMNLQDAMSYGVTAIMQPFVRSREDLLAVRKAMKDYGCEDLCLMAKIENKKGVDALESFFDLADEIVIARGDLGNAMPLWQLPKIQKYISNQCRQAGVPFMVVTQMLASMENAPIPTRAEVSDIYNAVLDGANSVMVTGETAMGKYPVEVIRYLSNTAKEALK